MLLAELIVRHTRRHMPTRRVALDRAYLPTAGPAPGTALLGAVVASRLGELDEEQHEPLARIVHDARHGLAIPRIALRHRLQHDTHGLDRSRHRVLLEGMTVVVELDAHGAAVPQVLGAVLAAASLPPSGRGVALRTIREALAGRWRGLAPDVVVRVLDAGEAATPPLAAPGARRPGRPPAEDLWVGVPGDQRWAMEVLGLRAGARIARDDVNRRFRRLLRDAHPDSGGVAARAAARIAELSEARAILLGVASEGAAAEG